MFSHRISFVLKTILFFTAIAVVVFLYEKSNGVLVSYTYYQIIGCMAVILLFVWPRCVSSYLAQWPNPYKFIFFPILFLIFTAHYIKKDNLTFPFVSWGMYTHTMNKETITYYLYEGVDVNGRRFRIDPSNVFRGLDGQIRQSINSLVGSLQNDRKNMEVFNAAANEKELRLNLFLRAVGQKYNSTQNIPLQSIEVMEHGLDVKSYPDGDNTKRRVHSIQISGGSDD